MDGDCSGADLACVVGAHTEADADLVLFGATPEASLGMSVDGVGDVDGDGLDDVVLGAGQDDSGGSYAGAASVLPGPIDAATVLADAWQLYGQRGEYAGARVTSAGDLDGDGSGDLLVGAYGSDPSYVAAVLGPVTATMDLHTADALIWYSGVNSYFGGFGVAGGGDIDGDGLADVALGAPFGQPGGCNGTGYAYVLRGPLATGIADVDAWASLAGGLNDCTGAALSIAGDVDGDGRDDLVAGVTMDATAGAGAGAVYVHTDLAEGSASVTDGSASLTGEAAGDGAGNRVEARGDVNGDGYADLLVGAWMSDINGALSGAAYLVLGPPSSGSLSAADAILMGGAVGGYAGWSIANDGGDVNGDGFADVLVGAPLGSGDRSGLAYLELGPISGTIDLAAAEASYDLVGAGSHFGADVSTAGDMTGDGFTDVLIGAQFGTETSKSEGSAYFFHGGAP